MMNKTDFLVQVNPSVAKIIGEVICKEIENSRNENLKIYDKAKKYENQYNQVTKYMEAGKRCDNPWPNAADYFVPLTEWIVDAVWARVLMIIFGDENVMTAKGVESEDTMHEEAVTDFVDQIHSTTVKLYDNFRFFVKQMLKLPFAVLKYSWEYMAERMIMKANAVMFMSADGADQQMVLEDEPDKAAPLMAQGYQPMGKQEVWITKDREIVNNPKLQYIAFEDYVWCPNSKRGYRPYWEGDRFWMTINEMVQNIQKQNPDGTLEGDFLPEPVMRLKSTIQLTGLAATDAAVRTRTTLFECYNWFGRLPFNKNREVDFVDPEAIEQEVHCQVCVKNKELLSIKAWEYNRVPYPERVYIRGEFEETDKFEGKSLCEKLFQTQKELNTFHNHIMNNAVISMMKIYTKKKTLQGEDWEKPLVYPGAMWEVDMQGDVQPLDVGDVKAIGWEIEQSLINFAERISNISIYQTGTARQGGQKTLGEVNKTISEGNIGMDKFIEQCHHILQKICTWTVDYYYQRMPVGLERRIRGGNGELIFPTQEAQATVYQQRNIMPYWSKEDIAGKYDFVWQGTSLTSSKQWKLQVANDMMERYLPQPMIAGNMLAVWDILRRGLIAREIKDWQSILPPKEAIIAEMQRMQAEAEAQKFLQRNQKNIPNRAVDLATKAGVPPEVAHQLANQGGQVGAQGMPPTPQGGQI